MRTNRLRHLLNHGKPTLGTRILSSWPTVIELIGNSKVFDYVEFSAEYAPYDHRSLEELGRSIELFDHLTGMIKVEQESRMHAAVRAMGAGFQSVLFADIRSADDARQCVQCVRSERPQSGGLGGVNLQRANLLDGGSVDWANALDEVVIVLMIEKREAIENLVEILAVPGIDMVQFGPADYANSIGLTGEFHHPEVKAAERFMIEESAGAGIATRVELNDSKGVASYLEMGIKHFNVGFDVRTLFDWYCREGSAMRSFLDLD
ncbi:aldolase/citrate lyase family protein [bacterium]|nr:aldolase/citrate lyase family protein [Rubripirellula sp.]MDB4338690.1 aldolase/citrate lyase family protein [Rubripirellula sp.]MDB4676782.1 aldolase/citrate lyase family protein [bacterium]